MDKLKKIKENWLVIVFFMTSLSSVFLGLHNLLNKYDQILGKLNTTQQMALKSVIWSEEIPVAERASACDVYLNAGYNSLTKKKCESIVTQDASKSVFPFGGNI